MRLFLAGTHSRDYVVKDYMRIFLAGEHETKNGGLAQAHNLSPFILESYFYARDNKWLPPLIPRFKSFMLDSGAFTYMQDASMGRSVVWNRYIDEYADFVLAHGVSLFFELDIDSVVGHDEVLRLRKRLESRVGRQCIPVWHKARGKGAWFDLLASHKYVAIGGIVSGEIKRTEHPFFDWFIATAHEAGARLHALGYTNLKGLTRYGFDSVDSTSWLYGNRSGFIYVFNGKTITKHQAPKGKGLKSREAAIHNFKEWVKFQQYADDNL